MFGAIYISFMHLIPPAVLLYHITCNINDICCTVPSPEVLILFKIHFCVFCYMMKCCQHRFLSTVAKQLG